MYSLVLSAALMSSGTTTAWPDVEPAGCGCIGMIMPPACGFYPPWVPSPPIDCDDEDSASGRPPLQGDVGGVGIPVGAARPTLQPALARQTVPSPDRATLVVVVDPKAKVLLNGVPMTTGSARRAFDTPALKPGQEYRYEITAELIRNGQKFQEVRVVTARAGEVTQAIFPELTAARNRVAKPISVAGR